MNFDRVQQVVNEYHEARKKMRITLEGSFHEVIKEFFNEYPEITGIVWEQYTPYFNDGEPCVFSVNDRVFMVDPNFEFVGRSWDIDEGKYQPKPSDYYYTHKSSWGDEIIAAYERQLEMFGDRHPVIGEAVQKMDTLFDSIPDEVFEAMYGDHVSVCLTRKGANVTDLDHD